MPDEKEIERRLADYQQLAKDDKKVDAAALMMSALETMREEETSAKKKRWAYLISVGVPPLGLFIAIWYYFGDKTDRKRIAIICVILTVVSGLASWAIAEFALSSLKSTLGTDQLPSAADLKGLLQ